MKKKNIYWHSTTMPLNINSRCDNQLFRNVNKEHMELTLVRMSPGVEEAMQVTALSVHLAPYFYILLSPSPPHPSNTRTLSCPACWALALCTTA